MNANIRRYDMGRLIEGGLPPAAAADKAPAPKAQPAAQPQMRSLKLASTAGLRSFLLEQMQAVADGKLEPERVKSICALAQQVYMTAKLEIEFAKAMQGVAPLQIGDDDDV